MYTLTLTREERKAIDWIGYRYGHGDDLKDLLMEAREKENEQEEEELAPDWWESEGDVLSNFPNTSPTPSTTSVRSVSSAGTASPPNWQGS